MEGRRAAARPVAKLNSGVWRVVRHNLASHVGHTCWCACLAMLISTEGGWVCQWLGVPVGGCGTRSVGRRQAAWVCMPSLFSGPLADRLYHCHCLARRTPDAVSGGLLAVVVGWGGGAAGGGGSGGCRRGMLRIWPPVGTHLALPLHTSHAITAITMHLCLLLGARGARLRGAGWVGGQCGRCPTSGMPPQPAGRRQHHAVDPVADSPCVCCVTMAGGWVHCHHGMWLNTPLNRRGGGPAGIRPCSCRGGGLAIDVIIHPCSLPVCMPWGVGGWWGVLGDLAGWAPTRGCELPRSAQPAAPR